MRTKNISEIEGYEEFDGYKVTDHGDVYSYWGREIDENGRFIKSTIHNDYERKLNPSTDSNGYPYIDVRSYGKRRSPKIHRLVALAFVPNPERKPQVNHIDGNKRNNKASNLEWVTNEENRTHAITNKLKDEIGYGVAQYDLNDNLIAVFPTAKKALESLGIKSNTGGNIGRVIRGKRSTAYGYKWKKYEGSTTSWEAYTQASGNREQPNGLKI